MDLQEAIENYIQNHYESLVPLEDVYNNFKVHYKKDIEYVLDKIDKENKIYMSEKGITWIYRTLKLEVLKNTVPWRKPENELTNDEKILARLIARSRRRLTTTQISKFSGMSWVKTKSTLESLIQKVPITKQTLGNRIYWFVSRD